MTKSPTMAAMLTTAALSAVFACVPLGGKLTHHGISPDWHMAWADDGGSGDDGDDGDDGGEGGEGGGGGSGGEGGGGDGGDDSGGDDHGGDGSGSGHHGGGDDGGSAVPDSGDENSGDDHSAFILKDGTRVEISSGGHDIVLLYANGWREEIKGGRYVLRDDRNRLVVDRAATAEDYHRLQDLLDA